MITVQSNQQNRRLDIRAERNKMACAALVWFKSACHARGPRFGIAVDQDFAFAEQDLGDLPVGVGKSVR